MKEKILTELRKAGDGYVSGTALCSLLGISRQAVWKNIAALKENGYQVESVASKGYRLLSEPDKMYGPDILSRIDKDCLCKQVESFECIDSTNTKVKQLAEAGERKDFWWLPKSRPVEKEDEEEYGSQSRVSESGCPCCFAQRFRQSGFPV